MDGAELVKVMTFLAHNAGVPKSTIFYRWNIFAYPFASTRGQWVGFKIFAYRGVDSDRTRVAKMALNHGLSILTGALGSGATGLGALGSALPGLDRGNALRDAFGVDIGGIQLAQVLRTGDRPEKIASAIISSGKLLHYFVAKVSRTQGGGHTIHLRGERRPTNYSEWSVRNIATMDRSATRFTAYPNGLVMQSAKVLGNYKH